MKHHLLTLLSLACILIFSIPAIRPLFHEGFFPMHDDTQPTRVHEMTVSLRSGQFPVRWVSDLGYGYGYPIFNFYAPLPYYLGSVFELIGYDSITATKLMMGIGMIVAGITMYFLAKDLAGEGAGILASILYMYAPYHSVDLYVRGAVGELFAYAFLPLVILGCVLTRKRFLMGVIGVAAVLVSHTVFGMIILWLLGAYGIVLILLYFLHYVKKEDIFLFICMCLLGIGLSSFFILPAFAEKQFTNVSTLVTGGSDFHQHFVYLDQLWDSQWGYAGSAPGYADGMSFKIGKLHIFFSIISLYLLIYFWYLRVRHKKLIVAVIGAVILVTVSIFFMTDSSSVFWETLPGFSFIQYPWRFLTLTVLGLSLIGGIGISFISQKVGLFVSLALSIAVIFYNGKYFAPQTYTSPSVGAYTDVMSMRFAISKISDEYLPENFIIPSDPSEISLVPLHSTDYIRVKQRVKDLPTQKIYTVEASQTAPLLTEMTQFPGWHAYIDGKELSTSTKNGRINVTIPSGSHTIEFLFTNTKVRTLANAISLLSLFLLVYVSLFSKRSLWPGKRASK
jgi:hypothetical protein